MRLTCQGTEPSAATVPPTMRLTAGKDEWERIEGENAREIENIDENGAARCWDLEESFSWPGLNFCFASLKLVLGQMAKKPHC